MSVLENFKNIPRSPYGGRQGSNVIFSFFKFATKSPEEKKRAGLWPPQRATGPCRPPQGRPTSGPSLQAPGGPVAPPAGDRGACPPGRPGQPSLYKVSPSFPPHLTSKNPPKIQKKKRGEEKGSSCLSLCLLSDFRFMYRGRNIMCWRP